MKSLVVKRSTVVAGHKTSVTLEDAFWNGLKEIASGRNITLSDLVTAVDSERRQGNLSSAIRLFVLDFYRNQLAHIKNGRDDAGGHFAMEPSCSQREELHPPQGRGSLARAAQSSPICFFFGTWGRRDAQSHLSVPADPTAG